jgi:hypothetical protein
LANFTVVARSDFFLCLGVAFADVGKAMPTKEEADSREQISLAKNGLYTFGKYY